MPSIEEILLRVTGDADPARREIDELAGQLEAFGQLDPTAELHVDDATAKAKLASLNADLAEYARKRAEGKVDLDTATARAKLDSFKAALDSVDRDTASPEVNLRLAKAYAEAATFEALLDRIDAKRVDVTVDVDRSITSRLTGLASAAGSLAGELGKVAPAAGGAGGGLQGFLTGIPIIPPVSGAAAAAIGGVLVPSIVALGAALFAIVASAAVAAAGIGALGVAAIAALGPIIALTAGVVFGLAKASQAQKTYEAAQEAVKAASEGLAGAEQGLQSAQTQRSQAQDALTRASKDAAEQIRNDLRTAVDGLRSAEDRLTDANYRAKQAEEDLTAARQAARRAIVDEQLAASSAALSHRGAILALRRARRELAATEADPDASRLDVAEARLRVRQAEDQVTSSRILANRAQRDSIKAERDGVKNAPSVVAARHSVADANGEVDDATRAVAEAERVLRQASAATVNQAPSVISARQAVASANQQVASSQRAVAQAADRLQVAQRKANKALGDLKDSRGALAVIEVAKRIGRAFGPALDPVFRGIARGLRALLPLIRSLQGPLQTLGRAMGRAFAGLARELARPAWRRFFTLLLRSSAELVRVGGRGFILLLRILRNIAEAALPYLIRGLRQFNRLLAGVARGSKDVDLSGPIEQLGLWLDLTYQLGRVFLGFVRAASGEGGGIVKWLADGAAAMADWLESDEGQEQMQQFFEDVLPLAKDLVTLFFQLALAVIQLGQFLAPVLDPFVKSLILVAKGLNFLLGLFNRIPGPVRVAILAMTNPIYGLMLVLQNLGGVARGALHAIVAAARFTARVTGRVWDAIKGAAIDSWRAIRNVAERVWEAIKDAITAPARFVRREVGREWGALAGIARGAWRAVLGVVRSIGGRIANAAEAVWHAVVDAAHFVGRIPGIVRRALQRAFRFIRGLVDDFVHIGERLIGGLVEGIKNKAEDAIDAVKGVGEDIKDEVTSGFGLFSPSRVFRGYGRQLMEGFRDGVRAGLRLVRDASRDAIRATKDVFQRGVEGIIDVFARLPHGLSRTTSQIGRLLRSLASVVRRAASFIMHAVRKLTSGLGSKLKLPGLELELPDLTPRGFARGGVSRERHFEVSEEGPQHPEIILATNPRYRGRNLGLWAAAGRMLGVPGFAQGGITGVPGFPGESASSRIMGALLAFTKRWKLFLTDAFGPGHASPEHTQYGTAADFVPGPGGSWAMVARAAADAVRQGFTPVGWTGAAGTEAWQGHGPPSVAGGNAHLHVTFLTAAELLAGKVLKGISGAIAALIPKIKVDGVGPVAAVARAAIEKMRDAGNAFIERHQPAITSEAGELGPSVALGPVIQMARAMVSAVWGAGQWPPFVTLEEHEANWNMDAMNASSGAYGIPQALPASKLPPGAGPDAPNSLEKARLQLQWMIGYIRDTYGTPAAAWAQYYDHPGGVGWYRQGGRITRAALGLIGAEAGASELALLPSGTQILPSDLTARLTKALLGTPGIQAPTGVGGAAAGAAGAREPTVQNFNVTTVEGGPPDPVAMLAKIGVLARQRGDL